MPHTKRADPPTAEEAQRIVTGPDPARFYCPHPGCNRSFAELWRLKVHFRAPPDVRGSGKERGHGTELKFCPKCGKDLRPGKHHVGCSAGKSAPRQAAKRQRQQQMSTTTESAGLTAGTTGATTEATTGSWELAVQRQRAKQQAAATARAGGEADSAQRKAAAHARACRLEQALTHNLDVVPTGDLLFHPAHVAHAAQPAGTMHGMQQYDFHPAKRQHLDGGGDQHGAAPHAGEQQQRASGQGGAAPPAMMGLDLPGAQHRSTSPCPLDLFGDPLFGGSSTPGPGGALLDDHHHHGMGGHDDDDDLLRIPSPPPLPADWEAAPRAGLLFDFDQFDATKRQQVGTSAPLVTVTTAMNPVDVSNPSDDYIWQILFAGENDAVPKRVTAHLHHPPATALSYLDEHDPFLDFVLADDPAGALAPAPEGAHMGAMGGGGQQQQQQQQQEGPGSGGTSGASGAVPQADHGFQQGYPQPGAPGGGATLHQQCGGPGVDAQVVPQPIAVAAGGPAGYHTGGYGSDVLPSSIKMEATARLQS